MGSRLEIPYASPLQIKNNFSIYPNIRRLIFTDYVVDQLVSQ